jgi:2-polyprenyl-3-methyl-5-hydroxy-6-metoxy-1,4-benzoquinol methylase
MPRDYYDDAKPALLELFDPRGLRILDAGCGGGRNGELARRAGAREVVGVELDAAAAARARERLDLVVEGDLATFDPAALGDEPFDAVLAVDVLEHMADPDAVLRRLVALLAPGGVVVASIPNVAHVWVIANLVMRRWPRNDSGIFDRTHLRFFAPGEMVALFQGAGLTVERLEPYYTRYRTLRTLSLVVSLYVFRGYVARQYLLVGRKAGASPAATSSSART